MEKIIFSQILNHFMTMFSHPVFVSLFLIISVLIFFIFSDNSSGKTNSPPSPPRLPLIGNLHQIGTFPHRSLRALSDKYGPLMLLRLGHVPTLVVSSADMVREIIKNHDVVFSNRPKTTAADVILYGGKDVAFSSYGEYWRHARKISVLELLSLKRVQMYQFVREEEVTLLIDRMRRVCDGDSAVSVNLSEMLIGTSNNIVSRCILGQRFEEENGQSMFGELSRRVMTDFMAFSVGDYFPNLRWIDVLTGLIGRLKTSSRALDNFLDQVIEEHKAAMENGGCGSEMKSDFVDILLRVQKDESNLTHQHIKAIVLDMFVGGSDTTSTGLEWLMAELIRNPRVMKKAQEEVRRVVGNKPKIDSNDINRMEYLKCAIKENLRLHPSLPLLLPRETADGAEIGGYHVPAKTRVFINAWAIQRDSNLWEKPEEFIPERHKSGSVDFKGHDFELVVFGCGRRGCPGLAFGVASTEYIIANLLYWFDWKLPDNSASPEDLDMSEIFGLSVSKKVPLHLVPTPYSHKSC